MAVKKPQLPKGLLEHSENKLEKKLIEWTQLEAKGLQSFIHDLLQTVNIPVVTSSPDEVCDQPPIMKLMDDGIGNRRLYIFYESAWSYVDLTGGGGAPSTDGFGIIKVSGQSNVEAGAPHDDVEFVAGSDIVITTDAVLDKVTFGIKAAGPYDHTHTNDHAHTNYALLETYTQTEANLADAVTKKHSHVNLALLETYTQTEANLADAVTKKHTQATNEPTAFVTASAGAGDVGKGIKLDADGHVDATCINDADIDHANIANKGTNTHAQIDTHLASTSNPHTVTIAQIGAAAVDHDATHIAGGSDEVDGDKIDIDYVPTNYTRTTVPAEVDQLYQLTAHLAGIDDQLAAAGGGGFPSGTKMWFYQAAAPSGWTIDNTLGDKVLAVHGTSAYSGSTGGGQQKGTWTISGGSCDGTSLTVANLPSHTHSGSGYNYSGGGQYAVSGVGNSGTAAVPYTGSGTAHVHSWSHNGTWRAFANVGIICTKD